MKTSKSLKDSAPYYKGIFAQVITMGEGRILARVIEIQKGKCTEDPVNKISRSKHKPHKSFRMFVTKNSEINKL